MITNKDLSIDRENGKITLNGNKYDLGTQGEIEAALKDVYSVMGQNGAKNLIPYPYVNKSQTINNVNFTDNGDGSISADNAATATTQFRLYGWTTGLSPLLLRKGTYILSGCPSGGGIDSIRLYLHNKDSSINIADDGEGTQFTLSDDTYVGIAIRVANGYDADGKTVYPMLRLAADTDSTYQPYAKTNKELTEVIGDLSQTGLTGDSVAEQLAEINSNLVGNVEFTLTFNSNITDINVHGQKCFYNPATKRVDIYFDIYSASNLIPGQNGTIATIPVAYRPAANVQTTALCLTTDNKLEAEGCFIAAVGSVGLNKFISSKANYKFVSARTSYYLN